VALQHALRHRQAAHDELLGLKAAAAAAAVCDDMSSSNDDKGSNSTMAASMLGTV
jgi:hypothetical protein